MGNRSGPLILPQTDLSLGQNMRRERNDRESLGRSRGGETRSGASHPSSINTSIMGGLVVALFSRMVYSKTQPVIVPRAIFKSRGQRGITLQ